MILSVEKNWIVIVDDLKYESLVRLVIWPAIFLIPGLILSFWVIDKRKPNLWKSRKLSKRHISSNRFMSLILNYFAISKLLKNFFVSPKLRKIQKILSKTSNSVKSHDIFDIKFCVVLGDYTAAFGALHTIEISSLSNQLLYILAMVLCKNL